jgi:hypothetical protein
MEPDPVFLSFLIAGNAILLRECPLLKLPPLDGIRRPKHVAERNDKHQKVIKISQTAPSIL